jgi:hypothetical protein
VTSSLREIAFLGCPDYRYEIFRSLQVMLGLGNEERLGDGGLDDLFCEQATSSRIGVYDVLNGRGCGCGRVSLAVRATNLDNKISTSAQA